MNHVAPAVADLMIQVGAILNFLPATRPLDGPPLRLKKDKVLIDLQVGHRNLGRAVNDRKRPLLLLLLLEHCRTMNAKQEEETKLKKQVLKLDNTVTPSFFSPTSTNILKQHLI